jgi:hypothetical protein
MAVELPVLADVRVKDMRFQYSVTGTYCAGCGDPRTFVLTLETTDDFLCQKGRATLYFLGDRYSVPVARPVAKQLEQAMAPVQHEELESALASYIRVVLQEDAAVPAKKSRF